MAYGDGAWVIYGEYNSGEVTSLYSADGINWSLKGIGTPIGAGLDAVTYDATNDKWVASNLGMGYGYTSTAYDAAWSNAVSGAGRYRSVTYGGGRVIGVGTGIAGILTAGTTWTSGTTLPKAGVTSA